MVVETLEVKILCYINCMLMVNELLLRVTIKTIIEKRVRG